MQPPSQPNTNPAPLRPNGRGAKARQRGRRDGGGFTSLLLMILFGPSTMLLWAMIYLGINQCRWMQTQVNVKQAQLTAFSKQYEVGQRRLAALRSNKGNEEILIENGYIPPGDRILLFPATPEEQRTAVTSANDLSPHEPLAGVAPPAATVSSGWRSAGDVLHNWWVAARAAAGDKSGAKAGATKAAASKLAAPDDDASATSTALPLANAASETATPPVSTLDVATPTINMNSADGPDASTPPTTRPTHPHGKRHHALAVESDAPERP